MLTVVWRFRRFVRPQLPVLGVGVLLALMKTVSDLGEPWPLKVIVDQALGKRAAQSGLTRLIAGGNPAPQAILVRALCALVLFVCLSGAFNFLSDYLMNAAGQRMLVAIRTALFDHLQRLSLAFHDKQRVGDLVSRITTDIDRLQAMLVAIFDTLLPNALMLIGLAAAMIAIDWQFGLLAFAVAPPLFAVTYLYTVRIKNATRKTRETDAGIAAQTSETMVAIRLVQGFSREDQELRRFATRNAESLRVSLVAVRLKAAFPPMVDFVSAGGTVLVIYAGVHRVLDGRMSLGVLLIFLAYLKSLYVPMRALSKLAYLVSQGVVSGERILGILEADHRMPEKQGAPPAPSFRGMVELRNVTFRYRDAQEPVLRNASLQVRAGERVGIVGQSGAGKSTLVSLIPRFYDPERGAILIDGIDVRDVQLASVRRQVSLVLQEPVLFYGSILENILYGNPSASMERVHEAAEAAHVMEFVRDLPEGLSTRLGERGVSLSGGQRQRITIARAMLSDAPILILDEPTSGLDAESERLVLDGLARLAEGKTTFFISHRVTALTGLDRIFSLSKAGTLVEVSYPIVTPTPPPGSSQPYRSGQRSLREQASLAAPPTSPAAL